MEASFFEAITCCQEFGKTQKQLSELSRLIPSSLQKHLQVWSLGVLIWWKNLLFITLNLPKKSILFITVNPGELSREILKY